MQGRLTARAQVLLTAGLLLLAVGALRGRSEVALAGVGILAGLTVGQIVALAVLSRARTLGLEMVWSSSSRILHTTRLATTEIEFRLRNRDRAPLVVCGLRGLGSPHLMLTVEPTASVLAPESETTFKLRVEAQRAGRHGLFGLAVDVVPAPEVLRVPLTFLSPLLVVASPRRVPTLPHRPFRRLFAETGPTTARAAISDGMELRQLRDFAAGDPLRHVAWRASARRGRLLVRQFERDTLRRVWMLVETTSTLLSEYSPGAPLDAALDDAFSLASRHLLSGDRVSGATFSASQTRVIGQAQGRLGLTAFGQALTESTACYSEARCGLTSDELLGLVSSHLSTLRTGAGEKSPAVLGAREQLLRLAERAVRDQSPHPVHIQAATAEESGLRSYLASFGIDVHPREVEPGNPAETLGHALGELGKSGRPDLVHLIASPGCMLAPGVLTTLERLHRRGASVLWVPIEASWSSAITSPHQETARFAARLDQRADTLAVAAHVRKSRLQTRTPPLEIE